MKEVFDDEREERAEHFDVLIVGAGISGIDAAYHVRQRCPEKSFLVLEGLESFGGTWLTHRYPGIRSDSDLYTFGYGFKPWTGPPIATASEILSYLGEVIDENNLSAHIRYRHRINSASWSSDDNTWTIEATRTDTGERCRCTASFLWMCQGYYRHAHGFTPDWPGTDRFTGRIVHPQTWPGDLDVAGKKIIVIGSGATAATLAPAIAADSAHGTVFQRSPTYYFAARNANDVADIVVVPRGTQLHNGCVQVGANASAHGHNHGLAFHCIEPLLYMVNQVFGHEFNTVVGADHRFKASPFGLEFLLFLDFLAFGGFLEVWIDLGSFLSLQLQLGQAAFIVDTDRDLVFHGALNVINVDVVAKYRRSAAIAAFDGSSRKADERCIGQRVTHVLREAINKVVLAAMGFVGNHHNVASVRKHGIFLTLV